MLASAGVLASIGKYLVGHQSRFVFVSSSDARELADLCEGAVDAESFEEFEAQFLGAKRRANGHERVLKAWQCDGRAAWDVLRRVDVHTISERQLEDKVRWGLSSLFLESSDLCDRLAAIVDDAVHRTIERDDLLGQLKDTGFFARKVPSQHTARQAVVDATKRYLVGVRQTLIQGRLIPRAKTAEVIDRLTGEQPGDCVLTGQAGAGKTGCVIEIVNKLRTKGLQVLAFRLDRHMDANTVTELGKRLDLEESPALVLSAAAKADNVPAVLIIDQLDAVSAMSGRSSAAFNVVEQLLMEAKAASIGTVVVCRAFDWHNDPRLRSLIREDDVEVTLDELSLDEVQNVMAREGRDARAFTERQLELLRLPQNLSLFLSANFTSSMAFSSVGDLLGRYWEEKRALVEQRTQGQTDRWLDVIDTMCDAMSESQQLSVRKEKLDQFSSRYLGQFVSENVLVLDGNRYAFGHESFFDYCFARLFVNKEQSLVTMLKSGEQHLFRRAQVRQVLAYLREAEFRHYVRDVRFLVSDGGIRTHIRDLVFAWMAAVDDPRDEEWDIWFDYVEPYLAAVKGGEECSDKQVVRSWEHVFYAKSWFEQFEKRVIGGWLLADAPHKDLATDFLRFHQGHRPDEVAAHLAPLVDQGGGWERRLRSVMFHPWSCHSRRHFELFLRLLDNGTLDVGRNGAINEEVGFVYSRLQRRQPGWIPELLAHQLHRLRSLIMEDPDDPSKVRQFTTREYATTEAIQEAAKDRPASFAGYVLPALLDLADATLREGLDPPIQDAVWPILRKGSSTVADVCLDALAGALAKLAGDDEDLREWIDRLSKRNTHIANHLLLAIYRGGRHRYADEAALMLCNNPWRLECGYVDSPYWCTTETLRSIAPNCSIENLVELERVLLAHVDPFEKTQEGTEFRGQAAFNLLEAIPSDLLSDQANRYFQEMGRKFGGLWAAPQGTTVGWAQAPIDDEARSKMNDGQWLQAIAAHPSDVPLARALGAEVKDDAKRFAAICLQLPSNTKAIYFSELLAALAETNIEDRPKIACCQWAFECVGAECGRDVAKLLATTNTPLPDDALALLMRLISEESTWDVDVAIGQGLLTKGLNTTRGRSALALGDLIRKDGDYISRLGSTLSELVRTPIASVSSCVAYTLQAVAYHDRELAISLFLDIDFSDERLLGTLHVQEFVRENLHYEIARLKGLIVRMLRSANPEVAQAGGRLACLAGFSHRDALELAEAGRQGNNHMRRGCAEVAAANIGVPACRQWCEGALKEFFGDDDLEVRRIAASCFRNVPERSLDTYGGLIEAFCDSSALEADSFSLLRALNNARERLPEATQAVCERLLSHDSRGGADTTMLSELVFRLYQQHQDDEWTKRSLDLIDRLCLEAPIEASHALQGFER